MPARATFQAALLTVSTSRAAGEAEDLAGPRLLDLAERLGVEVAGTEIVSDDRALIADRLRHWADDVGCDLILTSGGTGFGPRDLTPEATRDVLEREAPGIPEALRDASKEHTRLWMASRSVAGTRGGTLIVNLPGNPGAIDQTAPVLEAAVPHALRLLRGATEH